MHKRSRLDDRELSCHHDKMGDSIETIQKRRNAEEYARDRLLGGQNLDLDEDSIPWILNHSDCFVSQCRVNKSIKEVKLFPYAFDGRDEHVWDQGIMGSQRLFHRDSKCDRPRSIPKNGYLSGSDRYSIPLSSA
jgi:hypothetical protein